MTLRVPELRKLRFPTNGKSFCNESQAPNRLFVLNHPGGVVIATAQG